MLTKSRLNSRLRSEGSFSPRHISKRAERVTWSRPEKTCNQGRRELLGRQLRLEKGFSRSWHCTYTQVLNNASESRGDFSQSPRVNSDFFVMLVETITFVAKPAQPNKQTLCPRSSCTTWPVDQQLWKPGEKKGKGKWWKCQRSNSGRAESKVLDWKFFCVCYVCGWFV